MEKQNIVFTKNDIKNMSYPDFVGFINQTNVLPGAYDTLNRWIKYANIKSDSIVLDVACTTGFKLREISYMTGCKGEAFDVSQFAVDSAIKNNNLYLGNNNIDYFVCDGYKYQTNKFFTHVILGAGLGFFRNSKKMLNKCIDWLGDNGMILASPYYVKEYIPAQLVREAKEILGIDVTNQKYADIMEIYLNSGLEVIYQSRQDIIEETEKQINNYVENTVDRFIKESKMILDKEVIEYIKLRLYRIKNICNKLRNYQMYNVLVLRKRKITFPGRYVELF